MRARRERRVLYLLLACALVVYGALTLALMGGEQTQTEYASVQLQAAQLLDRCFQQVKGYKEELGIPLQELDYHQTGMLGEGYTGITTTLGALEAKRTTACPDMGALCVRLLQEAGVRPGDTVGAGFSGSFPAMNLAVVAACQAMEVRLVYISSVGSSTYGANNPELTFPEMVHRLVEDGLLETDSAAVTLGGGSDVGGGMEPALVEEVTGRLKGMGLPLMAEEDFQRNLERREELYRTQGPIRCFIAVGGNVTSMGRGESGIGLGQGLLRPERPPRLTQESGLVQRYLAQGISVIHLLNIKRLAADYGMPFDPERWPEPGASPVYFRASYPALPLWLGLAGAAVLLGLCAWIRTRDGILAAREAEKECDDGKAEQRVENSDN